VAELLKEDQYFELPVTTRLIARSRKDVVLARVKLATDRTLTDAERTALWTLIDRSEWFVRMVAKDYAGELERIDRDLEAEFSR